MGLVAGGHGGVAQRELKKRLLRRYGSLDVLLTNSGTAALALAIRGALDARRSTAVAVPCYCCFDVATAAEAAAAEVVLYDVDPRTLGPDEGSLHAALDSGVGAVVVVHSYGMPVDVEATRTSASRSGALVIEDAAQGSGGSFHGRPLGAMGDLSVLSLSRGKGLTAGGGGVLLANGSEGRQILAAVEDTRLEGGRGARDLLALTALWIFARPSLYWLPSAFPFLELGATLHKSPQPARHLSAAAAPAACTTWDLATREMEVRRRTGAHLLHLLKEVEYLRPIRPIAHGDPGYLRFPALFEGGRSSTVIGEEARRLGVMPGYPTPLVGLPRFRPRCRNADDAFPGAERLTDALCTMPTHSRLTSRDLARLRRWAQAPGAFPPDRCP